MDARGSGGTAVSRRGRRGRGGTAEVRVVGAGPAPGSPRRRTSCRGSREFIRPATGGGAGGRDPRDWRHPPDSAAAGRSAGEQLLFSRRGRRANGEPQRNCILTRRTRRTQSTSGTGIGFRHTGESRYPGPHTREHGPRQPLDPGARRGGGAPRAEPAQAIVTRRAETRGQFRGAPFRWTRSFRVQRNRARPPARGDAPKPPPSVGR
jgi:hypothetical protein